MKCPFCNIPLQMSDRQGIEIDFCPQCRGVWLDRGELDKIIERSAAYEARTTLNLPTVVDFQGAQDRYKYYDGDDYNTDYRENPKRHPQEKRRKAFVGDMFDIFD
jgi:uncharacterized protein